MNVYVVLSTVIDGTVEAVFSTQEKAEEKRLKITNPPCPRQEDTNPTKAEWDAWTKAHPFAQGCTFKKGATSWGGFYSISPGDIVSVEIFQ